MDIVQSVQEKRKKLISSSRAEETKRAVRKHWRHFEDWCGKAGYTAFPASPSVLEEYLIYRSEEGIKPTSLDQLRWAIDFRHKLSGLPMPGNTESVKSIIAGIKRSRRVRLNQRKALTPEHYKRCTFGSGLPGLREKVIIILGFASGMRRSELVNIQIPDIEFTSGGMRIALPFSKTNQEGKPEYVEISASADPAYCPAEAVKAWISAAELSDGYLLRRLLKSGRPGKRISASAVNKIVKQFARRITDDTTQFSCHSLRAGFATYMLERRVPVNIVAKQLRHKKIETTLRYDRSGVMDSIRGTY